MKIYLASRSPRRQQLLQQAGIPYQLVEVEIDENWDGVERPQEYVERMAREKAMGGARVLEIPDRCIFLGADTAVILDDMILGKAEDTEQAKQMLLQLSGRKHFVYTAVAILKQSKIFTTTSISSICFKHLSSEEIDRYCNTGEPVGKAGGYAIQGRAATFVNYMEGSYSGVVGLPLYETCELLEDIGFN